MTVRRQRKPVLVFVVVVDDDYDYVDDYVIMWLWSTGRAVLSSLCLFLLSIALFWSNCQALTVELAVFCAIWIKIGVTLLGFFQVVPWNGFSHHGDLPVSLWIPLRQFSIAIENCGKNWISYANAAMMCRSLQKEWNFPLPPWSTRW